MCTVNKDQINADLLAFMNQYKRTRGILPAAVEEHFLAVGHDDLFESKDLLPVGKLISGGGDHVSQLHRGPVQPLFSMRLRAGPPTDHFSALPSLRRQIAGDHRMWVRPGELHHRALDRHQLRVADRPCVMGRQRPGDANESDERLARARSLRRTAHLRRPFYRSRPRMSAYLFFLPQRAPAVRVSMDLPVTGERSGV